MNWPRLNPSHGRLVLDLLTSEGWEAELAQVFGYIPRWFSNAKKLTSPPKKQCSVTLACVSRHQMSDFDLKCTTCDFCWGLPQIPLGKLTALPKPSIAVFKGLTSAEMGGKLGREGNGERKGRERGEKGRGGQGGNEGEGRAGEKYGAYNARKVASSPLAR